MHLDVPKSRTGSARLHVDIAHVSMLPLLGPHHDNTSRLVVLFFPLGFIKGFFFLPLIGMVIFVSPFKSLKTSIYFYFCLKILKKRQFTLIFI